MVPLALQGLSTRRAESLENRFGPLGPTRVQIPPRPSDSAETASADLAVSCVRSALRALVDSDKAPVPRRDLLLAALHVVASGIGREIAHCIGEDRAADGEAHVPLDARARAQPVVDAFDRCAAAEDEAAHTVPAVTTSGEGDRTTCLALFHALDLPELGLDTRVLQRLDCLHHQLRPHLRVVTVPAPPDRAQLFVRWGDEKLEK